MNALTHLTFNGMTDNRRGAQSYPIEEFSCMELTTNNECRPTRWAINHCLSVGRYVCRLN